MRSIFIVVLILALINVGCVAPSSYGTTAGGSTAIATAPGGGSSIGIDTGNHVGHNHKHVRGGDRWPLWVAAGIALTFVVFIDLILLPFTYHDPFPCCRGVVGWCY